MSTSRHTHKDLTALHKRIEAPLAAIDLSTDVNPLTRRSMAFAELSGTGMSDYAKKLMVLVDRGVITGDDYRQLVIASIDQYQASGDLWTSG